MIFKNLRIQNSEFAHCSGASCTLACAIFVQGKPYWLNLVRLQRNDRHSAQRNGRTNHIPAGQRYAIDNP